MPPTVRPKLCGLVTGKTGFASYFRSVVGEGLFDIHEAIEQEGGEGGEVEEVAATRLAAILRIHRGRLSL